MTEHTMTTGHDDHTEWFDSAYLLLSTAMPAASAACLARVAMNDLAPMLATLSPEEAVAWYLAKNAQDLPSAGPSAHLPSQVSQRTFSTTLTSDSQWIELFVRAAKLLDERFVEEDVYAVATTLAQKKHWGRLSPESAARAAAAIGRSAP